MEARPSQHPPEWLMFLEICDMHLKKYAIVNPIVVELGVWKGRQKPFYEQILGAEFIGIDISNKRAPTDIIGNTHNSKTLKELKRRLRGRPINILFIDACHRYSSVKKDFELYAPLCSDIVALHDIEVGRWSKRKSNNKVWKFWDELRENVYKGVEGYRDFLLLAVYHRRKKTSQMGIGIVIKR